MELLFEDTKCLRQYLDNLLNHSTIDIEFIKSDGSNRIMSCTKDPRILPPMNPVAESVDNSDSAIHKTRKIRKPNHNVIVVYDTQISAWRSIVLERIKRIITGKFSMDIVVGDEVAL